jgi:hypothetical protein
MRHDLPQHSHISPFQGIAREDSMKENSVNDDAAAKRNRQSADRRSQPDRRQKPTSAWAALSPWGRRMSHRRAEEHLQPYFVDRFPPITFMAVMTLVIASLADAFLTIHLLGAGAHEVNPVMDYLLGYGVGAFLVGKYALTVCGLPLLLIFQNHYLFGSAIRVRHLIPAAVVLYAVLISYQIVLIRDCV